MQLETKGLFWNLSLVMVLITLSTSALAADTPTSRAMRDYYQALKNTQTQTDRDQEIKEGYKNKVGAAAVAEHRKNQEEFQRRQPPFRLPKKSVVTDEMQKKIDEKRRRRQAERAKSGKRTGTSEASSGVSGSQSNPSSPRIAVPDSRPASREEVVIDGRDVPAELEFPGKRPTPTPTHTPR